MNDETGRLQRPVLFVIFAGEWL